MRLSISDRDRRCDWLQTTAQHDVIWSIWAGDHGELSYAHLNGEWQFHAKSHELSTRSCTALCRMRSAPAWLPDICTCLADSLQQTVDASKFPTFVGQFTRQSSCTILLWQIDFLIRIASFCEMFMILFNFSWYLGLDSFPNKASSWKRWGGKIKTPLMAYTLDDNCAKNGSKQTARSSTYRQRCSHVFLEHSEEGDITPRANSKWIMKQQSVHWIDTEIVINTVYMISSR